MCLQTLVNHVLSNKQNLKIAVIENEFGGGEWTDTYTHIHAHANKHTPAYTDTHTLIHTYTYTHARAITVNRK
jgi:hypothetical protein